MIDELIPLGQFNPSCPQCGAHLGIKPGSVELKGNDRVFCPVHGDVMSVDEARLVAGKKITDDAIQQAIDPLIESFKRQIRDIVRE